MVRDVKGSGVIRDVEGRSSFSISARGIFLNPWPYNEGLLGWELLIHTQI